MSITEAARCVVQRHADVSSESAVAKKVGVDQKTINSFLKGGGLQLSTLDKLAVALPHFTADLALEVDGNNESLDARWIRLLSRLKAATTDIETGRQAVDLLEDLSAAGLLDVGLSQLSGLSVAVARGERIAVETPEMDDDKDLNSDSI